MSVGHHIVMGVLRRDDRVLLCHRRPDREWYPDVWDLPGGHVEPGETERHAIVRELREELGVEVDPGQDPFVGVTFDNVDASVWLIEEWAGEITNVATQEHDEIGWFDLAGLERLAMSDPTVAELCGLALGSRPRPPRGSARQP